MIPPTDAFEAGLRIAAALERAGVSYALGGALAYGQYGIPRATNDVDVNVFVSEQGLPAVFAALRSIDIVIDDPAATRAAEREGLIVLRFADFRVDVFTPSIAFSREAEQTRVRHRIEGQEVWFLSAEALAVFKLLFFRSKDLVDLERLLAVSGATIDLAWVRAQLVELMGADDPRVVAWDRLCADHVRTT